MAITENQQIIQNELEIFKKALENMSLRHVLTICDAVNRAKEHCEKQAKPRADLEILYPIMLKYKPSETNGVFWFKFREEDKQKRIEILKAIVEELEEKLTTCTSS